MSVIVSRVSTLILRIGFAALWYYLVGPILQVASPDYWFYLFLFGALVCTVRVIGAAVQLIEAVFPALGSQMPNAGGLLGEANVVAPTAKRSWARGLGASLDQIQAAEALSDPGWDNARMREHAKDVVARWAEISPPVVIQGVSGDESLATHEAAHAVVGHEMGALVLSATIQRSLAGEGRVKCHWASRGKVVPKEQVLWGVLLVAVAGKVSEREFPGASAGSRDDLESASGTAYALLAFGRRPEGFTGEWSHAGLMQGAFDAAAEVLVRRRGDVEDVRDALLASGRVGEVSARELRALLGPPRG